MSDAYVSQAQACKFVARSALIRYSELGLVPRDDQGHYHLGYLQRLKRFSGLTRLSSDHALMCMLEWLTTNRPEERSYVVETVNELLRQEIVMTLPQVAELVGYSSRTIRNWASRDFLPSVTVVFERRNAYQPRRIVRRRDALRILEIMASYTAYEAGNSLGITAESANRLARRGKIPAISTPDGWRFHPKDVEAYKQTQQQPPGLTLQEVLVLLDVPEKTLHDWAREGLVAFTTGKKGHRSYDKASVLELKKQREIILGGFDWLPRVENDTWLAAKNVAKKLGISLKSVGVLTEHGLLPHFDLSPAAKQRQYLRFYPESYVDWLVEFAKSHEWRMGLRVARDAKEYAARHYQSQ